MSLTRALVPTLFVLGLVRTAAGDDEITGFVTAAGQLDGRVLTIDGKPIPNAAVHLVSAAGVEKTVTADKDGHYQAEVSGKEAYVFVYGKVRIDGHVAVSGSQTGSEVVEIRETLAPTVMPKPLTTTAIIPEYSDALADLDVWARAWLMLDISETGAVIHVKLVNKPGFDLDAIAIREAFKLRFAPARDRAKRPIRAMMLWTYEWPSFRWLEDRDLPVDRLPPSVARVQCKPTASTRSHLRDCSKPDMAHAFAQPWLDKPREMKPR